MPVTLPHPEWSKQSRILYWRAMQREARMRELFEIHDGVQDKVLPAVAQEFGWTEGQAYIATEFLYRSWKDNV